MFRPFDRKLFIALESTGGTAESITTSTDFIEVTNPVANFTPYQYERSPKTGSMTGVPMTTTGGGIASPVGELELTFSVELAGPGTGVSSGTAPAIGTLLQACGMRQRNVYSKAVTSTSFSGGPFFHLENVELNGSYSSSDNIVWGNPSYGDSEMYFISTGVVGTTTNVIGQHSGAQATAGDTTQAAQLGIGYEFATTYTDSDTASTSLTMKLYVDDSGEYWIGKGMRGNVEFVFAHGDRVLCNFTFRGPASSYGNDSDPTDYSYTAEIPPAWINTGLELQRTGTMSANESGLLFNSLNLNFGNELATRTDTNDATGIFDTIITDRNPTMTFNPDAVAAADTSLDIVNEFLAGNPCRFRWTLGTSAGNRVDFFLPAAQFSGIADGERDSAQVWDSTTKLTGGSFGSSIISNGGATQTNTEKGFDNELFILFR